MNVVEMICKRVVIQRDDDECRGDDSLRGSDNFITRRR